MPRYFFDIDDSTGTLVDHQGIELDGREAVRLAAIGVLPDIAREHVADGDLQRLSVKVRDADDRPIFEAALTLTARWLDGRA